MKNRKDFDELDFVAEQMFDFACANRKDNLNKDGTAGDARKVACKYEDLSEQPMYFYRSLAKWHLQNK